VLWHAGSQEEEGKYFLALIEGFRNAGYIDQQNIALAHRYPNEQYELFQSFAVELVARAPDVLIAVSQPAALALQRTGTRIPIVFLIVPDPVSAKLVDSLARPGHNITGFANVSTDLNAKRLQLFKEAVPGLSRVALLVNRSDRGISDKTVADMQAAGAALRLDLQPFDARAAADFDATFQRMARAGMQGLITAIDPVFFNGRHKLAELAIAHRLPSIHVNGDAVEAGFLMSYGTNHEAILKRAPLYVDRLLKGTRPQDLPVEQPTVFEVSVNLKTARAIGLKLPHSVLLQAQRVVQ
jgi:putative ABC transport system substrate-binding protein